jgi:hypothetical protein
VVLAWAQEYAPGVTVRRANALATVLADGLPWGTNRGARVAASGPDGAAAPAFGLTWKPRATADDARALAARLEAVPLPDGCRHCGGGCEPGRLSCAWCRRVLDGEAS